MIRSASLDTMSPRDLYEVLALRVAVFVVEQACAYPELDGRDTEPGAVHWWSRDDQDRLTGYLRVLVEPGVGHRVGRVVTPLGVRGTGAGAALVRAALATLPGPVVLGAQVRVLRAARLRGPRPRVRRGRHPARADAQGAHRNRSGTARIVDDVLSVLLILLVVGALIALAVWRRPSPTGQVRAAGGGGAGSGAADVDAEAEARRWYDRLGGQVLSLSSTDTPSRQALADASERYTAAGSQLASASTPGQYRLVTDTALEGLHFVRAARTAMGMDPGPELPSSTDRARAGELAGDRRVDVEGRTVTGSPTPSAQNSHYYPGGSVAGRPVAAGWYSEPWWKPMLLGGAGAVGGVLLADALFSGFGGGFGGFDGGFGGLDGGGWDGGGWDGGGFDGGGFDGGGFDGFDGGGLFDDW